MRLNIAHNYGRRHLGSYVVFWLCSYFNDLAALIYITTVAPKMWLKCDYRAYSWKSLILFSDSCSRLDMNLSVIDMFSEFGVSAQQKGEAEIRCRSGELALPNAGQTSLATERRRTSRLSATT